jgi:hypothetical protein
LTVILFQYPVWFVFVCLFLAVLFSAILYWRNKSDDLSLIQTRLLAVARFIVVFFICILLLSPILERNISSTEEPIIIFVQDNSESILLGSKMQGEIDDYSQEKSQIIKALSQSFDVQSYVFGDSFRRDDSLLFTDKITDISLVMNGIKDFYSNRNVGAVIIASDGIYNQGNNPAYEAADMQFPIYTIALGDTVVKRDLIINKVSHNAITFLGNFFPVEVLVEARKSDGASSKLEVRKDGEILYSKILDFKSDYDFQSILIDLEAVKIGTQKYEVSIAPIVGETNVINNRSTFFIDVIDSRQKILILGDSPHPDIGAIKQSIEDNENYEVEYFALNRFSGNISSYNLIILHQLPSKRYPSHRVLAEILENKIPALWIVGANSNLNALSNLDLGLAINQRSDQYNNAYSLLNVNFALYSQASETEKMIPLMPPLSAPFANYKISPAAYVLLFQKIGNVDTNDPLVFFADLPGAKYGFICGEGIWRWRLNNYLRNNNHKFFDDFITKIVQYLAVKEDKSLFRVSTNNVVYENEPLVFEAELYNASYELINDPVVSLVLVNEDNVEFNYEFSRTSNSYILNAGLFPPGNYSYNAKTVYNAEIFEFLGLISIAPLNLEALNTVANHGLLFNIASETGAKMYYPGNLSALVDEIKSREDISGIIYTQKEYSDLISWKWLFFLLIALLSIEWFVRKRTGIY